MTIRMVSNMAVLSSFSFKKKTFRAPGFSSLFDTLSGLGVLPSDDQILFAKIILVIKSIFYHSKIGQTSEGNKLSLTTLCLSHSLDSFGEGRPRR